MPTLNFQSRFVPLVECGAKRQTIRASRKRPIKVGDTLYLRTNRARLLRSQVCNFTEPFFANDANLVVGKIHLAWHSDQADAIARADGFDDAFELRHWLRQTHGFPFVGQIIRW